LSEISKDSGEISATGISSLSKRAARLTRRCPSRRNRFRSGAPGSGALRLIKPDIVFTHPYEGGHPDHDFTAFAVHAACRLTKSTKSVIAEFASYNAGPMGDQSWSTDFLSYPDCPERIFKLTGITEAVSNHVYENLLEGNHAIHYSGRLSL
jgi:hypothetical protein